MDKIRISQIAKEIGKTSKEILQKAQELGFEVKNQHEAYLRFVLIFTFSFYNEKSYIY